MNAIELLKIDHKKVEELFALAEASKQAGEKKRLFKEIKIELHIHAYAEEMVFYPFFLKKDEFKEMVEHAYDEHQEAKSLIDELDTTSGENEFDNKLMELIDAVRHHVKDEETELFPKIRSYLSAEELIVLGDQLLVAKQNYAAQKAAA